MSAILDELVEVAGELGRSGLVTGAGGNVSAREGQDIWVSPSGMCLAEATARDYPRLSVESGEIVHGDQRPTSEALMHLAIYRVRPDITFVIHTHPKTTIALTSSGHDLRAMYPDYHVFLGVNVPHLPYVTVSTQELADAVQEPVKASNCFGIILRNHGAVTVGTSSKEALYRMLAIEEQATIQWQALQVGTPTFLSDAECLKLDQLDSEEYRRQLVASMKR